MPDEGNPAAEEERAQHPARSRQRPAVVVRKFSANVDGDPARHAGYGLTGEVEAHEDDRGAGVDVQQLSPARSETAVREEDDRGQGDDDREERPAPLPEDRRAAQRQPTAVLPVVEHEVEAVHVVGEREEAEPEKDPADRVPPLRPRDHVADAAVRGQHDEGDPVVRRPGVLCHGRQRDAGNEEQRDRRRRRPPQILVAQNHAPNLRPWRYGIVTRRNDPGTEEV